MFFEKGGGLVPLIPPLAAPVAPQKIPFLKFLMTSLHVICGSPPSPIKNPGYAYAKHSLFFVPVPKLQYFLL